MTTLKGKLEKSIIKTLLHFFAKKNITNFGILKDFTQHFTDLQLKSVIKTLTLYFISVSI